MRDYRAERLALQEAGQMPKDWPTAAWQMFAQNYLYEASTPAQQYERIAATAAKQFEDAGVYPDWWESEYGDKTWTEVFYDLLFNVHIVGSTPVLANAGTTRGAPVSCSGGVVPNNIHSIYQAIGEVAVLSKHGFGTSVYMGDVCPRGTPFKGGGKASGTVPFMQAVVQAARDVRQGSCFPVEDGVELLTEHGFISFSEAERRGSLVAQVLDDGSIEFVKPLGYINQDYAGDVYTLKDSKNVDIRMTGNHNVAYTNSANNVSLSLVKVEEAVFGKEVYMAATGLLKDYSITGEAISVLKAATSTATLLEDRRTFVWSQESQAKKAQGIAALCGLSSSYSVVLGENGQKSYHVHLKKGALFGTENL